MLVGAVAIVGVVLWAPFVGAASYYGYMGTIGTLALILVYMGITVAQTTDAVRGRKKARIALGVVGTMILLWPLYNSVYPTPAYPGNLWPYLVIVYLIVGLALLAMRPVIVRVEL